MKITLTDDEDSLIRLMAKSEVTQLDDLMKGGNYGHPGRPGYIGGSGPGRPSGTLRSEIRGGAGRFGEGHPGSENMAVSRKEASSASDASSHIQASNYHDVKADASIDGDYRQGFISAHEEASEAHMIAARAYQRGENNAAELGAKANSMSANIGSRSRTIHSRDL